MSRIRDDYETSRWKKFKGWLNGETDLLEHGMEAKEAVLREEDPVVLPTHGEGREVLKSKGIWRFKQLYKFMSVALCLGVILTLLWTVAALPITGNADNPDNNEVAARYIERGLQETGAVNIVTGMI